MIPIITNTVALVEAAAALAATPQWAAFVAAATAEVKAL